MFDRALIEKYNRPGPRYTSYPTALQFTPEVDRAALVKEMRRGSGPLSVYIHLPFCEKQCWFCGCNTIITRSRDRADAYLDLLEKEIDLFLADSPGGRPVNQLHFGGGTPNFLTVPQIQRLGRILHRRFQFTADAECGVELAPAHLDAAQVEAFAAMGINRASFGVQDCNPTVQAAINRIQPHSRNRETIEWLRKAGIESVNIDLVYGLPFQDADNFRDTIDQVAELAPDRLAVFNYAHVPWIKPAQKM
ncbi:MAG: radical SAM protein, partial [Verrucomicrobiota bacterium]